MIRTAFHILSESNWYFALRVSKPLKWFSKVYRKKIIAEEKNIFDVNVSR
jgi:hypothetical protein